MADFQYGPFERLEGGPSTEFRVFYDDLCVHEPTRVLDAFLNTKVPLYVPPLLFSRLDQSSVYCFASRFRTSEYVELDAQSGNHPYRELNS